MPEWATQNHIQCDVILSKLKPIYGVTLYRGRLKNDRSVRRVNVTEELL